MKYNCGLPLERKIYLESVLDYILFSTDQPFIGGPSQIGEEDICQIAKKCNCGEGYLHVINFGEIIRNGYQEFQQCLHRKESSSDTLTEEELRLMEEDLVERFYQRLRRYSEGRHLHIRHFSECKDAIGFRWEE